MGLLCVGYLPPNHNLAQSPCHTSSTNDPAHDGMLSCPIPCKAGNRGACNVADTDPLLYKLQYARALDIVLRLLGRIALRSKLQTKSREEFASAHARQQHARSEATPELLML